MHFNTSLPPVSLGAELFSNYRQEKGSFPWEGEEEAGSGQERAEAAAGRGCARSLGCSWSLLQGDGSSSGGFALLKAGFISRRKGKEER